MLVYKLDKDMYKPEQVIDGCTSGCLILSLSKILQHSYGMAVGSSFNPLWLGFWSLMAFANSRFLTDTYFRQAYFINEIELTKELDQVKVTTVLTGTSNLYAAYRLSFVDKTLARTYTFPIAKC